MEYFPLFTRLQGRSCLLVGAGAIALRKARLLLRAGAMIDVVAPSVSEGFTEFGDTEQLRFHPRPFAASDVTGRVLVVAATNDRTVNTAVSEAAQAAGVPVNVVDSPDLCTVVLPAIIDRSPMLIAVGSAGRSPVLARQLRARLEAFIPAATGDLAEFAGERRPQVRAALANEDLRRRFWEAVLEGPVAETVMAGRREDAAQAFDQLLSEFAQSGDSGKGEVYLVGAGPGDPDLLTFRALRLMQKADIVLYDRLVSAPVLDMVRRDADRIHVGKQRDQHTLPQEQINRRLVELAKAGKRVLRLKGGDPFIFGRGGEEIASLAAEGIPFQVVPGITAASGCGSYAGIPLTHRDHAQSLRLVTGHLKDGSLDLPWQELVAPRQTLVFYMGLVGLPLICEQLAAHGMATDMPAALIEKGTTPQQRVITGTIADLPQQVTKHGVSAPTLLIIGTVVRLRDSLKWFEHGGKPPEEH